MTEEQKQQRREYMREYRQNNRDRLNDYQRKYNAEHRDKHAQICAKYRDSNMTDETREKIKAYQKWYYRNVTKNKKVTNG